MGGLENGLVNLINHLPADEFRHAIACVEDFSDFRERIVRPDVEVFALRRSTRGASSVRHEIHRLCRRLRPAIVHSRNLSGLDALLPARLAGVKKIVHSEHGWDVDNIDGRRWKPALLRRLHSPFISRYVAVSKDLARFLAERIGIDTERIAHIYNGVDTDRFRPPVDSPKVGRRPDWPPAFAGSDIVVLGSVCRLQPVKDLSTLLDALGRLIRRRPDLSAVTRLVIVGDGPLSDSLQEQARLLGVAEITWFVGASTAVPEMLRAFDVFVLPSLNEGVSNTILEAMASGLPVVASAVGGNVELVADGMTGTLFGAGDASALAAALERYLDDGTLRRVHGRAARRRAESKFSLRAMVDAYAVLYAELCRRKGIPGTRGDSISNTRSALPPTA